MRKLILCAAVVLCGVGRVDGAVIYWTDVSAGGWQPHSIMRANSDGSGLTTLLTEPSDFRGMAVDSLGGKMYWTNTGALAIKRANLDGSSIESPLRVLLPLKTVLRVLRSTRKAARCTGPTLTRG